MYVYVLSKEIQFQKTNEFQLELRIEIENIKIGLENEKTVNGAIDSRE